LKTGKLQKVTPHSFFPVGEGEIASAIPNLTNRL
jgi:hypothetical protein